MLIFLLNEKMIYTFQRMIFRTLLISRHFEVLVFLLFFFLMGISILSNLVQKLFTWLMTILSKIMS